MKDKPKGESVNEAPNSKEKAIELANQWVVT